MPGSVGNSTGGTQARQKESGLGGRDSETPESTFLVKEGKKESPPPHPRQSPEPTESAASGAKQRDRPTSPHQPAALLTCAAKPQVADAPKKQEDHAAGRNSRAPRRRHRAGQKDAVTLPPLLLRFPSASPLLLGTLSNAPASAPRRSPQDLPGSRPPWSQEEKRSGGNPSRLRRLESSGARLLPPRSASWGPRHGRVREAAAELSWLPSRRWLAGWPPPSHSGRRCRRC